MKLLAIVAAMVTVTASYPIVKTWTLGELSYVIEKSQKNDENPETIKYQIDALNQIMYILFTGTTEEVANEVLADMISPTGSKFWTKNQVKKEFEDPDLDPELRPYLQRAYQYIMVHKDKDDENLAEVVVPALDISTWSAADVSDALADPETNEALIPFLERAKEEFKEAFQKGDAKKYVTMVTPVSLVKTNEVKPKYAGKKYSVSKFK